ncbi:MAG: hypothetical protein KDB88_12480, partial [Flavobacteriales bacterium]|nr:hypothetical protein [Flavobacteriales bacterium]
MDKERLTDLLPRGSVVEKSDLVGLKELTERFPWFSGAHLLLAVGEHEHGDVMYQERLLTAAAHLPSRSVLYGRTVGATNEIGLARPVEELAQVPEVDHEISASNAEVRVDRTDSVDRDAGRIMPELDALDEQVRTAARSASYDLTVLSPIVPA